MKVLSAVPIESFPDAYNFLHENADTTFLKYPSYEEVLSIISQFNGLFPNAKMRIDENYCTYDDWECEDIFWNVKVYKNSVGGAFFIRNKHID